MRGLKIRRSSPPRFASISVLSAVIAAVSLQALRAQDLAPRAYVISPVHSASAIRDATAPSIRARK